MKMRWLLLVVVFGGCSVHRAPPPIGKPEHFLIQLTAKNTDFVCAETSAKWPMHYCMTVGEFRLILVGSVRAEP